MKKLHFIYAIILLSALGCTDYLDENPDNRIEANTLDKASELLVAAYPKADYLFTDGMTGDVEYIVTNTQIARMTDIFLWEELDEYDDQGSPGFYWNKAYEAIAQANAALEAIDKIESYDFGFKDAIKGEALLCRAYAHFMLVTLFANNYNETTAASDLGIPYVVESEKVLLKDYTRSTVLEVYNFIEKDLLNGMSLMSDDYYSGSKRFHFTTNAANAFACRFYLYKGNYTESIKYANLLLGENAINLAFIKDLNEYGNQSGSSAKKDFYSSNIDASNILIVEKLSGIGLRHSYGYRTGTKQWSALFASKLWKGSDLRDQFMGYYGDGARNTIYAAKFKEEFYKESLTATSGYPFYVQPVLRGEELLFNRIESNIHLGNTTAAMDDLNAFAAFRYSSPNNFTIAEVQKYYTTVDGEGNDVVPDEQEALLKLMLDEKRKEFLQEGMRWLDIKRNGISVTHITYEGKEVILEEKDPRKVLQIPINATNRGIKKNPR